MAELRGLSLSEKQVLQVVAFTEISGSNDEILSQLESMKNEINSDDFALGTAKLRELLAMLRNMGLPEQRIQLDLRIARGLDYYTGVVYEITNYVLYVQDDYRITDRLTLVGGIRSREIGRTSCRERV